MEILNVNGVLTMSSLEIVKYVNSTRKAGDAEVTHANFLKKVPNVLNGDEVKFYSVYLGGNGQERPCYNFPKRESMLMAMSYSYELQARVFDAWVEAEAKLNKPKTPLELAREQVVLYERLEAQEKALQLAIETKAEIGSKREATAMNTASQAVKQVNRLEIELDRSKEYCTVKRMEMLQHGQKFDWRKLKSAGVDLGIDSIDVFDANYGKVKAYHREVWLEAYALTF